MTTTTPTETPTLATQQAVGLRALANLIEDNPELAEDISYTLKASLLGMPMYSANVDVTFCHPGDPEDNTTETFADLDAVDVRVLGVPQTDEVTR